MSSAREPRPGDGEPREPGPGVEGEARTSGGKARAAGQIRPGSGGLLLLGLALCLGLIGCGADVGLPREHLQLEFDGRTREVYLQTLPGRSEYRGLVLVLHGGGGRAKHMPWAEGGRFSELAAREGMLLAYPQGIDRMWNEGPAPPEIRARHRAYRENVDDVGFLLHLMDELGERHPYPSGEVYVCGISNGGRMTMRMLIEHPQRVAAAGVVVAQLRPEDSLGALPGHPVPLALLLGTADPLVPYAGGMVKVLRREHGVVLSGPETFQRFRQGYACGAGRETVLADRDPEDGTLSREEWATECAGGAEVLLVTSEGGGHTWPGGAQYLPRAMVGPVVRDFHGSERLWQFWRRHGLGKSP